MVSNSSQLRTIYHDPCQPSNWLYIEIDQENYDVKIETWTTELSACAIIVAHLMQKADGRRYRRSSKATF